MVISSPPSSFVIVMQSLTYCTDSARCASSFASRSRSASISVTDPQHVRFAAFSSPRTFFVS